MMVLGQQKAALFGTWLGGTGSVWGGTGWYLVVLSEYVADLVDK